MVVKTLLKRGIKKLTKKKPKTKPKTKPTPRYRTDPKTGERFLNRRATVSGVNRFGVTDKEKKTAKTDFGMGAVAGLSGAGAAYGISKTDKFKKTAKKLKEATDKIREKDKKKKEKRKDNQRQK
jgi:hypothetical protein